MKKSQKQNTNTPLDLAERNQVLNVLLGNTQTKPDSGVFKLKLDGHYIKTTKGKCLWTSRGAAKNAANLIFDVSYSYGSPQRVDGKLLADKLIRLNRLVIVNILPSE